jgi:hypothetical protein
MVLDMTFISPLFILLTAMVIPCIFYVMAPGLFDLDRYFDTNTPIIVKLFRRHKFVVILDAYPSLLELDKIIHGCIRGKYVWFSAPALYGKHYSTTTHPHALLLKREKDLARVKLLLSNRILFVDPTKKALSEKDKKYNVEYWTGKQPNMRIANVNDETHEEFIKHMFYKELFEIHSHSRSPLW